MTSRNISKVDKLIQKGVKIPKPHSVEIGDEVDIDRISANGVTINTGCKIFGHSTLILQGVKLGYEGPVTVENCQIGPQVSLKGGYFKQAVFLRHASMGLGAHVREGTILEEQANGAHTVALKQTILFPFVTLGSLINFCDCFMAGGTSRQDHSEVGSSYIHFNYTPNQDKATPSLIGDVPQGVMLNQRPIFLGGQGGIVGPCRLAFGTTIAAGSICRKEVLKPGLLIFEGNVKSGSLPYSPGIYRNINRILINNIIYIANLIALEQWYVNIRSQFISDDFPQSLLEGLIDKLQMGIEERVRRLAALSEKMPDSIEIYQNTFKTKASSILIQQKKELFESWSELETFFNAVRRLDHSHNLKDVFLEKIRLGIQRWGRNYTAVIQGLDEKDTEIGTRWLQCIVDAVVSEALSIMPSYSL